MREREQADKIDWAQFLGVGHCVFHFQPRTAAARGCMVGQIHDDVVGGAGRESGVRAGGGVFRVRVSGLDGGVQLVGDGDIQARVRLEGVFVARSEAGGGGPVWAGEVVDVLVYN